MDLDVLESLAFAEDREKALVQLIPGTEDYYFHHALHLQREGRLDEVPKLLAQWIERHGRTSAVHRIERRQTLLEYDAHPDETLDAIRRDVGARFDHAREVESEERRLPSALDPRLVSRRELVARAMNRSKVDLSSFTDDALRWVGREALTKGQRQNLLDRLSLPDDPDLVEWVLEDLLDPKTGAFGSRRIHARMLHDQLDELARRLPGVREQPAFVNAYLAKLAPRAGVDVEDDQEERTRYLDRLEVFALSLGPSMNLLKVVVLYHRLALDRARGVFDYERFRRYVSLPRAVAYAAPEHLKAHRGETVSLGGWSNLPLPKVTDDEPLVRELVERIAIEDHGTRASRIDHLAAFIRRDVLNRWRAFAMIGAGLGDMERWYAELDDPAAYGAYRDRVDLELEADNAVFHGKDDPVDLSLRIKNVKELVVAVFEIDAQNYAETFGREVDTAIDLDGLVAGHVEVIDLSEECASPYRVVRKKIRVDAIRRPGVYLVELIGNGKSSRALIRKGALRMLERIGSAGHVLTVLDEEGAIVTGASAWLGGRRFDAEDRGEIVIPFTGRPGPATLVLSNGDVASVEPFRHRSESYRLAAGFYVDREQIIEKSTAELMVRAALYLEDVEVSLDLLEDVRLEIAMVDAEGTPASTTVSPFTLAADRETIHRFEVPNDLRSLTFTLTAKVRSISEGRAIDLSAADGLSINGADATDAVHDLFLAKGSGGYVLHLVGKTGEPLERKAVTLDLRHRAFHEAVTITLETDGRGRLELGHLEDIGRIDAKSPAGVARAWEPKGPEAALPGAIHARPGDRIRVPYAGGASREEVSLLELRGGSLQRDWIGAVRKEEGALVVEGLPPGDFELHLFADRRTITLRVEPGEVRAAWIASSSRQLELRALTPITFGAPTVSPSSIELRLSGASPGTRVHVVGGRFLPAFSMFGALARIDRPDPRMVETARARSRYVSGRDIGDEYRYILERKQHRKRPGNMLERPGLLLNPWAVRKTGTEVDEAAEGGEYERSAEKKKRGEAAPKKRPHHGGSGADTASCLDFLGSASVLLANLRPDANGVVAVPRSALLGATLVRLVAVDRGAVVSAEVLLPEGPLPTRDLRMARPLDPAKHFLQKKERSLLVEGSAFTIDDVATAEIECIDTLAKVHGVMSALTNDATLLEFGFAVAWPSHDHDRKRALYGEYACHELHLFLERKDPAFFSSVVRDYLENKRKKTFMDEYLLGRDLSRFLAPHAYGRLNTLERILLAKRIGDGATRRHVEDRFDLLERNVEEEERLFRTVLSKSALETGDALGFRAARDEATRIALGAARGMAGGAMAAPAAQAAMAPAPEPMADLEFDDYADAKAEEAVDERRRVVAKPFYRAPEKTEEWAENDYYRRRVREQDASLIPVNGFWRDFARHDGRTPFLSGRFAEATSCFAEMMCALAVLDLPFVAGAHEVSFPGASMVMKAKSSAVVLHREIRPCVPAERKTPILVSQNYFRKDDRHTYGEDGEQREKYVTGELLTGVVYVCQIVVTNPSSSRERLDLLLQIPEGSIPVGGGVQTRGRPIQLEPYSTQSVEYAFYFPAPGTFRHYPAHVGKREELVTHASHEGPLVVVRDPSAVDQTSWAWVSQHAELSALLAFLETANVERLDLERIAWRMRGRPAYDAIIGLLERRHRFDPSLWAYALRHRDLPRVGQYLLHDDYYLRECGPLSTSPVVEIDPVDRAWYEHLEYLPLINARAHRLGGRVKILNSAFEEQYRSFLALLAHRPRPSDEDLLAVAYYLFLQDRVDEGLAMLARIDRSRVAEQLQADYLWAYAAIYTGDHAEARRLAERHQRHPVERWRRRFEGVIAALDGGPGAVDPKTPAMTELASGEGSFEIEVDRRVITVTAHNVSAVQINYYRMDVELLFSRQPFVQKETDRFSMVRPNRSDSVPIEGGRARVPLPAEFSRDNVIVEAVARGQRKRAPSYAHDLAVFVKEQYGHVYVTRQAETHPVAEAYVKVYARMSGGEEKFYKDGYTDARGCFDYASLSTDELDGVERFALLILTTDLGAVIREARPAQR
jgi:hypothetical protein